MNDRLDKRDGDGSVGELNTANVAKVSRFCLVRGLFVCCRLCCKRMLGGGMGSTWRTLDTKLVEHKKPRSQHLE